MCRLKKALYGLKQALRAWFQKFATHFRSLGFLASKSDTSLFVFHRGAVTAYALVYVDNIILTASSASAIANFTHALQQAFELKDLGSLHYFLGISVRRSSTSMFLSQRKYIEEILDRAHMRNCNPCSTLIEVSLKLLATSGPPIADPTLFRNLAELSNISPLLVQISVMLFSRCVCSCMIPVLHTLPLSNMSSATSRAPLIMVSLFLLRLLLH